MHISVEDRQRNKSYQVFLIHFSGYNLTMAMDITMIMIFLASHDHDHQSYLTKIIGLSFALDFLEGLGGGNKLP